LPIHAALKLAAFILREICEQDARVGVTLQLYTLKPGEKVIKQDAEQSVINFSGFFLLTFTSSRFDRPVPF
jgi:hypothetical protein